MSQSVIKKICNYLSNKRILILGYGREGRSTLTFMLQHMDVGLVYVGDRTPKDVKEFPELSAVSSRCHFGEDYLEDLASFDLIIKTPGISMKDVITEPIQEKLCSQTELMLQFCSQCIVGVTGTKGKSTTASLIHHVLSENGVDSKLIGNIGVPPFSELPYMGENTVLVYEMSSHQLEYVKHSPSIAVLLNVYPEHLDHYMSFEAYRAAKYNIFAYQDEKDVLIYNGAGENMDNCRWTELSSKTVAIYQEEPSFLPEASGSYIVDGDQIKLFIDGGMDILAVKTNLMGTHNMYNIAAALAVCQAIGIEPAKVMHAVASFTGLPHRLEYVGTIQGVKYYNDSIATIPQAAISSIECFEKVDTLLIGGMDRGISYEEFAEYLCGCDIEHIICLPDVGWDVADRMLQINPAKSDVLYKTDDLRDGVKFAKQVTKEGGICLMSPAATSYGFFKNFEERGQIFKDAVKEGNDCILK